MHLRCAIQSLLDWHVVLQEGRGRCHGLLPLRICPCAAYISQDPLHNLHGIYFSFVCIVTICSA